MAVQQAASFVAQCLAMYVATVPASDLPSLGPAACYGLLHRELAGQASQGRREAGWQAKVGAGRREVRVGGAALESRALGGRR